MSTLATKERTDALEHLKRVIDNAIGKEEFLIQSKALDQLYTYSFKGEVAPLDWLEEYFLKKGILRKAPPSENETSLATLQRQNALEMLNALIDEALTYRGNSLAQRHAINRMKSYSAKAKVPPLSWMWEYISRKVRGKSINVSDHAQPFEPYADPIKCNACGVTFKNLYAYNGHGPTMCNLKRLRNEKR